MLHRHFYNKKLTVKFGNEFKGMWHNKKEKRFFNPKIDFSSKQLAPYTISGSIDADMEMRVKVDREATDNELWGYSFEVKQSPDALTLIP